MSIFRRKCSPYIAVSVLLTLGFQHPVTAQLAGAEFQVNTYSTSHQRYPALAAGELGGFVVAWESFGQDGSSYGIFGRQFDALGDPSSGEFQVNTYTTGIQRFPSVATLGSGEFVVAWSSPQEEGWNWGVFAQRFSATGDPVGTEFHVNTYTTDGQYFPVVASDISGGFVVVWESLSQDGSDAGVFAQRFSSSANPIGSEFQVNSQTTGRQDSPVVATLASGQFVVVWESREQDGAPPRIFSRRFDASGQPLGDDFQIGGETTGWQSTPEIASDSSGGFVVAWERNQFPGSDSDVRAQVFDSSGAPLGASFPVNTYTASGQSSPAVAADIAGGFVVSWSSWGQDGWDSGIFAQRFDSTGDRVGAEQVVSSFTSASQSHAALSSGATGEFVVVWESRYQDGSSFGVFGQRLAALVFADGFSSGGSCAWSATVGGGC